MIRSLELHENREAKKDKQLYQHLNLQELCVSSGCPLNKMPVLKTPVVPIDTSIVLESCQDIVDLNTYVATELTVQASIEVDEITIHDVKLKCAQYSYVTIAGHPVKVKQDTRAEVNMMTKVVFEKLCNGKSKNSIVLNKAKMTNITGYGQDPIDYIGTFVFKVKHNVVTRDVLFFIMNIDDTKVIFGSKACQTFNLVKILCDDQCHCKRMKLEVGTFNEDFPIGLSFPDKLDAPKLPPVDIHTKIDAEDPKSHILCLFPELFEGIGTMKNVQVHLNVDPKIEPVVQAPGKIPHSMLELLKEVIDRMLKLGVICKLHINKATDWVHNLVIKNQMENYVFVWIHVPSTKL